VRQAASKVGGVRWSILLPLHAAGAHQWPLSKKCMGALCSPQHRQDFETGCGLIKPVFRRHQA
jgi:hypothetical protein